jgi:hypothetical protein
MPSVSRKTGSHCDAGYKLNLGPYACGQDTAHRSRLAILSCAPLPKCEKKPKKSRVRSVPFPGSPLTLRTVRLSHLHPQSPARGGGGGRTLHDRSQLVVVSGDGWRTRRLHDKVKPVPFDRFGVLWFETLSD